MEFQKITLKNIDEILQEHDHWATYPKDIHNMLVKNGFELYDVIHHLDAPDWFLGNDLIGCYAHPSGKGCGVRIPGNKVEFSGGSGRKEVSFDEIRHEAWAPPTVLQIMYGD